MRSSGEARFVKKSRNLHPLRNKVAAALWAHPLAPVWSSRCQSLRPGQQPDVAGLLEQCPGIDSNKKGASSELQPAGCVLIQGSQHEMHQWLTVNTKSQGLAESGNRELGSLGCRGSASTAVGRVLASSIRGVSAPLGSWRIHEHQRCQACLSKFLA